ncbi:MAG: hypothetical protein QXT19_03255 [Candidatus Woesearchaeota archaeon]
MKKRVRELWRKVAHVVVGTGCLGGGYLVLQAYGSGVLDLIFGVVLALLLIADILIADYGRKLPFYHWLQRSHEAEGLHTATLGFAGSIIAYKLFALPVAMAAISMLIYGDAAAAVVGLCAAKKGKYWKTSAMLFVSLLVGWWLLGGIGVVMGVVATVAEAVTFKVDDALAIPIIAGIVGQALFLLL